VTGQSEDGVPEHAGVLVPWANMAVEAELHRVTGVRVAWHYARLVPPSRTTGLDDRFLTGLLSEVPGALGQLEALPLSRTYLACTSAAFMYPELAGQADSTMPTGAPRLVSAFDALTAVLSDLSAASIVLLTPYPTDVTHAEAATFIAEGISVTAHACLGLKDGYGSVTHRQIMSLLRSIDCASVDEADAIVLSCTGWATLDLIPEMRQHLSKPVISSNLAIGLHALRKERDAGQPHSRAG
jgi:maleate isomerase